MTIMRNYVRSTWLLAATLWLAAGPALAQPTLPWETIEQGEISGYGYAEGTLTAAELVIDNEPAWARFWAEHTSLQSPPPPLPDVPFGRQAVVVVLLGIQNSGGGPFIEVRDVVAERPGGIMVRVLEDRTPGPLDVITNPYHIIRTSRLRRHVSFLHQAP